MIFHRGERKIDLDISSLNHISLKKVKFTKFLGVIIDDQLKWTNHILYTKKNSQRFWHHLESSEIL